MPFVILLVIGCIFALPWLTGSTFGQQCAKAFDRDSPAWEQCIERMGRGGSLHFEKKIILVPIEK